MTSKEKIERFWRDHGAQMFGGAAMAAAAFPMLQEQLAGKTAEEIDQALAQSAVVFLSLRSDDAPAMRLISEQADDQTAALTS